MKPTFYHTLRAGVRLSAALLFGTVLTLLAVDAVDAVDPVEAQQLAPSSQRGWLGIVMDERAESKVFIKEVMRSSPAEAASLRVGDQLLRINGTTVRSARDTAREVGRNVAGSVVQITTARNGSERTSAVRLMPFPSAERLLHIQHVDRPAPALRALRMPSGAPGPTLDTYKGKVLIIDFWASWCLACRDVSTHLNQWHDRYRARGLEVLGVASESVARMAKGAGRFGIRYPTCADPDTITSAAYHVHELPTFVVIGREGVVRGVATGYDRKRLGELEGLVQRLLAEPAPR